MKPLTIQGHSFLAKDHSLSLNMGNVVIYSYFNYNAHRRHIFLSMAAAVLIMLHQMLPQNKNTFNYIKKIVFPHEILMPLFYLCPFSWL